MCCHPVNRREFLGVSAGLMAGVGVASAGFVAMGDDVGWSPGDWDPDRPLRKVGRALRVQPILMYSTPQKREQTSWKSWGGVQTEPAAEEEAVRIGEELRELAAGADFGLDVLPVIKVKTRDEAAQVHAGEFDVSVIYPATGSGTLLKACAGARDALIFVRHRSGPVYYWYEALSVKYLDTGDAETGAPQAGVLSVHDVVVDDPQELLWRFRALFAVHNFRGARVVALGGIGGKYAENAPEFARTRFNIEIIDVPYTAFEPRLQAALADPARMAVAEQWAARYLAMPGTTLETERPFVVHAFVLLGLFRELLREHNAHAFTIMQCMGTIMPMSRTTACLTLSLMNDEGVFAFCESDFVIIPPGLLLRYITGKPVFMHNSTFPHEGMVTCAHCTGPRRMDGQRYEPARLLTHYESEYGAAPKIDMPLGQQVMFIDPEYSTGRWLGFTGEVRANPFFEICRSQQDVALHGEWQRLIKEVRDSHWVMAYGDFLRETGYAARKLGIRWETIA